MGKVTFSLEDEYHGREIKMSLEDGSTWSELSEEFFLFLQACGYFVTRSDLAKHWAEYLEEQDNDSSSNHTISINVKESPTMASSGLFNSSIDSTITVSPSTVTFSNNPLNWSHTIL